MDTQVRLGKVRLELGKRESAQARAHTRGEHGFVKLTDEEYDRLVEDLGETEAKRVIAYVDESAASTGNKNKWKDWNLVLRKAARDKWGVKATPKRSLDYAQRNYTEDDLKHIGIPLIDEE